MSDFWCPLPWIHRFVQTDGIKTCCQGIMVEQTSITDFSNSTLLKEVKQAILNNEVHPNCRYCSKLEEKGIVSTRLEAVKDFKDYTAFTIPDEVEYLDLRYSNLCNFSCRTCEPSFSSSIVREIENNPNIIKWYNRPNSKKNQYNSIADDLNTILPNIKRLNFTGGEPLLIKENLLILEKLNQSDCAIQITTNASVINPAWFNALKKFNNVHWTVSIDGIEKTAEYIRYGTVWETVDKNIQTIMSLGHSVAFNTVLSAYSVLDLARLVEYFIKLKQKFNGPFEQWFHICSNPIYLSPAALSKNLQDIANIQIEQSINLLKTVTDNPISSIQTLEATQQLLNTSSIENINNFFEYTKDLDNIRNQQFNNLLIERS